MATAAIIPAQPRDDTVSDVAACWRRRSARFVWAGRASFLSLAGGLLYAGHHALSFAPALREAQFRGDAIRQTQGIDAYAAFWRETAAAWPEWLARYPVGPFEWAGFISIFAIVGLLLWAYRDRAKGDPIDLAALSPEVRQRFETALASSGRGARLYARQDDPFDAARSGDKVYIPRVLMDRLVRKLNDDAVKQLSFVLEHEAQHSDALDNFFVAIGRSIILVATVVIATFTTNFIIVGAIVWYPTSWIYVVGDTATMALVAGASLIFLFATGAIINGFNAAFYGIREFFADVIPASQIGPHEHIYANTGKPERRGTILAAWDLPPPPPDRLEHLAGATPRTGALAAFATALWVALRTLILVVDPRGTAGLVWAFDGLAIAALAGMLAQLPRRTRGRIDYGLVPWIGAGVVIVALIASAWGLRYGAQHLLGFEGPSNAWLAAVTAGPLAVAVALAGYTLTPVDGGTPSAPAPFNRPQWMDMKRIGLWLLAMPSLIVSYLVATYALYLLGVFVSQVTSALSGYGQWNAIYAMDMAGDAVAVLLLIPLLRNLSTISACSAWIEAALDCLVFGFAAVMLTLILTAQNVAAQTARDLNFDIITEVFAATWQTLLVQFLVAAVAIAVILVPSWWARLKVTLPPLQPTTGA